MAVAAAAAERAAVLVQRRRLACGLQLPALIDYRLFLLEHETTVQLAAMLVDHERHFAVHAMRGSADLVLTADGCRIAEKYERGDQ